MMNFQNDLQSLVLCLAQALLLLLLAPMITGIVKKVKALLQNRIGSSISKNIMISKNGGASLP